MAVLYDDFQRADGALGGDWETGAGAMSIAGGWAGGNGQAGTALNTSISDDTRIFAEAHIAVPSLSANYCGPMVKCASSSGYGYLAYIAYTASVHYLIIAKFTTSAVTLASVALGEPVPGYGKISLEWNAGTLTAVWNDTVTITVDNSDLAANPYAGIRAAGNFKYVNDIRIIGGTPPGLSVTPDVIGNYGACTELTLTGTGTDWTAGTPGAPIFTVNHGTISEQTVDSETQATITYCPGSYLGGITFTDPTTGNTATAVVTSNPSVVPPTGTQFSPAAIAYIERSAIAEANAYILNTTTLVGGQGEQAGAQITLGDLRLSAYRSTYTVEGEASTAGLLYILFGLLSGYHPPRTGAYTAPSTTTLKEDLDAIQLALDTLITANDYTLGTTITTLTGEGAKTHLDILNAIGDLETGGETDLTPVLNALATLRGDQTTTLYMLLQSLAGIRTLQTYSLGDVKDWIDGIGDADTGPIMVALAALGVVVGLGFSAATAALAPVAVTSAGAAAGVITLAATLVNLGRTIADILAAIEALGAPATAGPPVWPGEDNVTLGEALALTDGRVIPGPLDGILVAITSVPPRAGQYGFGATTSYAHVGAALFRTDQGAWETAQQIAVEAHVLCPKVMRQAASATIRVNSGFAGTVTPWTVTL